jgi:hypothetical protein
MLLLLLLLVCFDNVYTSRSALGCQWLTGSPSLEREGVVQSDGARG